MTLRLKKRDLVSYWKDIVTYDIWQSSNTHPTSRIVWSSGSLTKAIDNWISLGWDIPDFHRRKNRGDLLPMTPYHYFSVKGSTAGSQHVTYDPPGSVWAIDLAKDAGNWVPWDDWIIEQDDVLALAPSDTEKYSQFAAAKIVGQSFDLLTFVAELASTKRMFLDLIRKLLKLKVIPRNLRGMTSEWLAIRYGWRPLLNDIKSFSENLARLESKRTRYSDRAGNSTSSTSTTSSDDTSWYAGTLTTVVTETVTIGVRGSVIADIQLPDYQLNPLITGWEVIPFSFVIDWFIDVGKSLAALSFIAAQANYSACSGYSITLKRDFTRSVTSWKADYSGTQEQTATCTAIVRHRVPCHIPLLPQLRVNLDRFKVMDLLALLMQRIRR
jgi:hypothetical protein